MIFSKKGDFSFDPQMFVSQQDTSSVPIVKKSQEF